jgi:hypothetical protein
MLARFRVLRSLGFSHQEAARKLLRIYFCELLALAQLVLAKGAGRAPHTSISVPIWGKRATAPTSSDGPPSLLQRKRLKRAK